MLTRSMRQAMRHREGQALVVAALLMFVMSIAVLTTVNMGFAIKERVRLQNTADASAYSMAALEARAFNFYAFANRAQVSHYVSAMVWQSTLSFTYFMEAFLVDAYGVMKTLNQCDAWYLKPVCKAIPGLSHFMSLVDSVMKVFRTVVKTTVVTLETTDPDRFIGRKIIPAHRLMNQALAGASQTALAATLAEVGQQSQNVVRANDPDLAFDNVQMFGGKLSQCILSRAHVKEALGNGVTWANISQPLDPMQDDDASRLARAKRSMGNVTNGSRFSCDNGDTDEPSWCSGSFVTDRREFPLPKAFGQLTGFFDNKQVFRKHAGQTKFLSFKRARGFEAAHTNRDLGAGGNWIRDWSDPPHNPIAMLAQGDNMGSDDLYEFLHFPGIGCSSPNDDPKKCWGDNRYGKGNSGSADLPFRHMLKTSIWAFNDHEPDAEARGGLHYRVVHQGGHGAFPDGPGAVAPSGADADIGLLETPVKLAGITLPLKRYVANIRPVWDGNHRWEGVVPFPHFEPGQYDGRCQPGVQGVSEPSNMAAAPRTHEFNQPSTWAMFHKAPAQLRNPKGAAWAGTAPPGVISKTGTVSMGLGKQTKLMMDNARKTFMGSDGMNVVARGQSYYHRPGNWAEHPNFFNPYWRPRLASVLQGRYSNDLVDTWAQALPAPLKKTPQKVMTH